MKYMKTITLWISMVYLGVSFVNAQSPGKSCCGSVEYDPGSEACCPNGNKLVDWGEHWIAEWCEDCTFVKKHSESRECCDSTKGTFSYKTTLVCQCYSCMQSDCTRIGWEDYLVSIGTGVGNPLATVVSLAIQNGELLAMDQICGLEVCPDFDCSKL